LAEAVNLVFDLDGTLIDSAPQIHDAANKVFQNKGLQTFSNATVRGFIGNGVGVLINRLMAHQGLADHPALQSDLVAEFLSIYEEAFDLTTLYPGVSTALADLAKAGHRLAICTNKPIGPTHAVLRHFGLTDLFPVVIGGDSLPQRKPDPDPLWAACNALGPGKALFIGDSEVDAATAKAAGVPLALYSGGYRKAAPDQMGARIIFDSYTALPGLIRHLLPRL
jgi:phosphoglycolate phosphatase